MFAHPSSQLSEELTTKLKEYLHLVEKTSVTMEQEGVRRSYMSLATYWTKHSFPLCYQLIIYTMYIDFRNLHGSHMMYFDNDKKSLKLD